MSIVSTDMTDAHAQYVRSAAEALLQAGAEGERSSYGNDFAQALQASLIRQVGKVVVAPVRSALMLVACSWGAVGMF